jgi:ABC-type phosphate/phosphonate transport system substrate-binding protein
LQCGTDCDGTGTLIVFNPQIHKPKYRLGVTAFANSKDSDAMTFSHYLTATAGSRFDPPIEFEVVPSTAEDIYESLDADGLDFIFVDPGTYSCVGVEYGAEPLATAVFHRSARGITHDLDLFGGVMFALAENYDVNAIGDFKDKIIGAKSISELMAGQLQFYEMEKAGLSYIMDPKQVVFTNQSQEVVRGVINGDFDVGFVRTGVVETSQDADGDPIDHDIFKIINPKVRVAQYQPLPL